MEPNEGQIHEWLIWGSLFSAPRDPEAAGPPLTRQPSLRLNNGNELRHNGGGHRRSDEGALGPTLSSPHSTPHSLSLCLFILSLSLSHFPPLSPLPLLAIALLLSITTSPHHHLFPLFLTSLTLCMTELISRSPRFSLFGSLWPIPHQCPCN